MHRNLRYILIFLTYSIGLWLYAIPFVGDQKVYISTAMEMWEKGAILRPYLMGETSYFKPPWLFWMILSGWKVFGYGLFGTFVLSAVATSATAYFLDRISEDFFAAKNSYAGLCFAGCFGTLTYGTTAQMEIWVVFFYCVGWYAFLRHKETGHYRWLVLGGVLAGVAAWNKSPLYSVFAVLGYWLYLLLSSRRIGGGGGLRALHFCPSARCSCRFKLVSDSLAA